MFGYRGTQLAICAVALAAPMLARTCESLASLQISGMAVSLAQNIGPGQFQSFSDLPSFCRVAATLWPTSDSEIKLEVWLPEPGRWNGKYEAAGNGGSAGSPKYRDKAARLHTRCTTR